MVESQWQRLHAPHESVGERRVTWLELFYDLVYVAVIIQLGDVLSPDVSWSSVLGFVLLFVAVWSSWMTMTVYINRLAANDWIHRLIIFSQMFAIAILAINASDALDIQASQFALSYAVVRIILLAAYGWSSRRIEQARPLALLYAKGFGAAIVLWIISAFVPPPFHLLLWVVAVGIEVVVPLLPQARGIQQALPFDISHLSGRYALFTIIILGDIVVKLITSVSAVQLLLPTLLYGLLGLLIAWSMWSLYFDDIAGTPFKSEGWTPQIWSYGHLPAALGLTAFGVGITDLILPIENIILINQYLALTCGAVALYLAAIALIGLADTGFRTSSRNVIRAGVRLGGALVILVLALFGGTLDPALLLALVAAICIVPIGMDSFGFRRSKMQQPGEAQEPVLIDPTSAAPVLESPADETTDEGTYTSTDTSAAEPPASEPAAEVEVPPITPPAALSLSANEEIALPPDSLPPTQPLPPATPPAEPAEDMPPISEPAAEPLPEPGAQQTPDEPPPSSAQKD